MSKQSLHKNGGDDGRILKSVLNEVINRPNNGGPFRQNILDDRKEKLANYLANLQRDLPRRRNRSHPLPLILSVAAGLAFV
jgi:hypothetical protein